jgi:predicted ATPase/class 3 adenylate cyclase
MGFRPSGTVTFLFTDIEGSSRLWDKHGAVMGDALSRHDAILAAAVERHDGLIFSQAGDGVAAAFQRSGDALDAALEAQRRLAVEPWPDGVDIRVRMGLHTGEVEERGGGYFGSALNRAARLMAAGTGGQVLVSGSTAAVLSLGVDVELVDMGSHRFRGLTDPIRVFSLRSEGLACWDRPLATTAVGNLPLSPTRWVGRTDELRERSSGLAEGHIVLTLTGSGGVGKSRMAVELARLAVSRFVDGAWLVELAPVGERAAVVSVVASTLSIRAEEGMTLAESIVDWLRERQLLLVIDNCEHVIDAVADLVSAINRRCPGVTVLATSREPLGIDGERVYRVPSLLIEDAAELFRDRASARNQTITFSQAESSAITAICERLDGIPLAIELAAARSRSLSTTDLLARLDDRFRLLRGNGRGGLERHQTLRATVAWSYRLLSDEERALFDRLSVFAGSFNLAAADAVCGDGDLDSFDLLDLLSSLVDKSMVGVEPNESPTRYRLLETLRQYGEERLDDAGLTARLRDRHCDFYLRLAQRADRVLQCPDELEAVQQFEWEWPNLRAAHSWTLACSDGERAAALLGSVTLFAGMWGRPELAEWAERTLASQLSDATMPTVCGIASYWDYVSGDTERALVLARRGLDLARSVHDPATTYCWFTLASTGHVPPNEMAVAGQNCEIAARAAGIPVAVVLAVDRQAQAAAATNASELPALLARLDEEAQRTGSPTAAVIALTTRGRVALASRRPETALDQFGHARALAQRYSASHFEASATTGLAIAESLLGVANADRTFTEGLALTVAERNWGHVWRTVRAIAHHLTRTGRVDRAAIVYRHLAHFGRRDDYPGDPGVEVSPAVSPVTTAATVGAITMDREQLVEYLFDLLTATDIRADSLGGTQLAGR